MKDTKTKLLKTAARLFAKKGYAETSVRQLVQRAGANLSAVQYHFGDKYGLYLATVRYLMEQTHQRLFGDMMGSLTEASIQKMTRAQARDVLHQILDRLLDLGFERKDPLLERIFIYAELEDAEKLVEVLMGETQRRRQILRNLLSRLTGLKQTDEELVLLCYSIFGQANQSDFIRLAICNAFGIKKYTPQVKERIKEMVWQNTCAILKIYEKRK